MIPRVPFWPVGHVTASTMLSRLSDSVPVEKVREILGHASTVNTMSCAHLRPEHLDDTVSAIDGVLSGPNSAPTRDVGEAGSEVKVAKFRPSRQVQSVGR